MNLRWLAVALFLTSISLPAALMADDRPTPSAPIVKHPSPGPTDGDPTGPPGLRITR